jgi:hypothetical protein
MQNNDWGDNMDEDHSFGCVFYILVCIIAALTVLYIIKSAWDWIPR